MRASEQDILESIDPDAGIDPRQRDIEHAMNSDRPGMLIRRKLLEMLSRYGEQDMYR